MSKFRVISRKDGCTIVEIRPSHEHDGPEVPVFVSFDDSANRAIEVGDEGTLFFRESFTGSNDSDIINVGLRGEDGGIPGNSDPSIRKYHGWRGTNTDVGVFAYGWRRVLEYRPLSRGEGSRVVFSADLRPDQD